MIRQNFRIALNNAKKNKRITFINIIGLALGLTCTLLIYLWVNDELNYEKFYQKSDQIHLAYLKVTSGDDASYQPTTSPIISKRLKEEFPEVIESGRVFSLNEITVKYNDNLFNESTCIAADHSIFSILDYNFIEGSPSEMVNSPNSIIITKSTAQKYFGKTNPLGKELLINNKFTFVVKGIIKDLPKNAYKKFDFIIPFEALSQFNVQTSGSDFYPCSFFNYTLLHKQTDCMALNEKIRNTIMADNGSIKFEIELVPLSETYLKDSGGSARLIIFSIISFFVLLLACINYTNITIGSLLSRLKEIGVKKVNGANKRQIITQLLTESILMSYLALFIALIFTRLILSHFNTLTNKQIDFNFNNYQFLVLLLLLPLFTGFISGILPGLKFASTNAITILKNKATTKSNIGILKKGLVIFQFVITIFFIISTIVIQKQSRFISNYNVGFNKQNVYFVRLNNNVSDRIPELRQQLQQNPQIENIASASVLPNHIESGNIFPWGMSDVSAKRISEARVDYNYLELFNMKLAEGRFFNKNYPSDAENSILLSQSAFNALDDKEALGKIFHYGNNDLSLIGVVEDYQHSSALSSRPSPVSYILSPNNNNYLFIKLNATVANPIILDQTIRQIHDVCDSFSPNRPLYYNFLNNESYAIESQFKARGKLVMLSTILTILISIIGLLGLVIISIKHRIKEIGIRKVNGASITEITGLISTEYINLIGISLIIAFPLAYFALKQMLQLFANKIDLSWWIFALAGLLAIGIALLTVSWQSWKAARRNPVEALRYE
jgi:putative ABC transport system permease protein